MAQPPSPHAITGSLSLPGNLPRSSGRKTTWPGEPRAGSDITLYGPGIAFGAPSSGSVVLTRSALGPGACANETHAVRTNAVVSADFMRRSLADGNTTGARDSRLWSGAAKAGSRLLRGLSAGENPRGEASTVAEHRREHDNHECRPDGVHGQI